MPTARTKVKPRTKGRRGKAKSAQAVIGKKTRRKGKPTYSAAYDAKMFAGSVAAFAEITPEEMRAWRDDR